MNSIFFEQLELQTTEIQVSRDDIVLQLTNQHAAISNKLLPEIEMHFWSLMKNNVKIDNEKIISIYQIFANYKSQLEDHFYFEEKLVFPAILKNQVTLSNTASSFIEKHEDFELLLGKTIAEIQEKLAPLREHMSLRILELKLESLSQIMEEHQILEDYLFAEI